MREMFVDEPPGEAIVAVFLAWHNREWLGGAMFARQLPGHPLSRPSV
jgi:hypothetical protein